MFRNLQTYRLPAPYALTADELAAALSRQMFAPASSNEVMRQGFTAPRNAGLVHAVNGQFLLTLATERKILPAAVIQREAQKRAAELEEAQGFAPGKKAMKELKERIADELLPRAFSKVAHTNVWIDPKAGWLVVDAATPSAADDVIKLLLKSVDRMPLESLRVQRSPVACMTEWLANEVEAPAGFTIDHDATLRAAGESKAEIRYVRHALDMIDMHNHIEGGKKCVSLAMTWQDKISFVLDESLAIKSVKALDVLKESAAKTGDDERFDSDFALMTGDLAQLLADLVESLGGEARA